MSITALNTTIQNKVSGTETITPEYYYSILRTYADNGKNFYDIILDYEIRKKSGKTTGEEDYAYSRIVETSNKKLPLWRGRFNLPENPLRTPYKPLTTGIPSMSPELLRLINEVERNKYQGAVPKGLMQEIKDLLKKEGLTADQEGVQALLKLLDENRQKYKPNDVPKDKKLNSKGSFTSFTGTDIVASITIPSILGSNVKVIGELQTISYSIHREVSPVRTLGRINPTGFTAGPRTVAGSMIFTVFDHNMVYEIQQLLTEKATDQTTRKGVLDRINTMKSSDKWYVMDEMPPFDVTISMKNEYGVEAFMVIKDIIIVDEGQVMSIEDMLTENTMTYIARDIQVLKKGELK